MSRNGPDIREQYSYLKPQPFVWLAVLVSAAAHLGLVGLVVLGGILEERRAPLRSKAIITRLVKKGVEKPDHILPVRDQPKPPPPAPAPRPLTPSPEAPPAAARPKPPPGPKQPERVDYSKAMASAFDKIAPTRYEQQGDPDGVEDGDALIKQKGDEYLTKIYKAVKARYEVPELIPPKERLFLQADALLRLDAGGHIKQLELSRPSGNQLYDNAVIGAIRRAAPFGPPPAELAAQYEREGIAIPFRASRM